MLKIIEKLLYQEEDPTSKMSYLNRRWRWWLAWMKFGNKWGVLFGIERQLVQYEGKVLETPRPLEGLYMQFRPLEWRFGTDHIYYDGPHCLYMFGPFWLTNEFNHSCKECAINV